MQKQLKIVGLETDVLRFPPGQIFYDAIHEFGAASGAVVLRLQTNAGITGWATSSFGTMEGGPLVLQSVLQNEVKQVLVGQDPAFPKRLRSDLWKALEYSGVQGVAQLAIASAEVAIWDILGKCAQVPVYKMLGAFADKIPTYSMCGWYYPNDNDLSQFKKKLNDAFEEEFTAAKIKVGRFSLDDDVKRIKVAMEIAGRDRPIMVDANQKMAGAQVGFLNGWKLEPLRIQRNYLSPAMVVVRRICRCFLPCRTQSTWRRAASRITPRRSRRCGW